MTEERQIAILVLKKNLLNPLRWYRKFMAGTDYRRFIYGDKYSKTKLLLLIAKQYDFEFNILPFIKICIKEDWDGPNGAYYYLSVTLGFLYFKIIYSRTLKPVYDKRNSLAR